MAEHSADKRLKHLTHLNTNELTCLNLAPQKPKIRGKINKSRIRGSGTSAVSSRQREKPKDYRTPRSLAEKQREKRGAGWNKAKWMNHQQKEQKKTDFKMNQRQPAIQEKKGYSFHSGIFHLISREIYLL